MFAYGCRGLDYDPDKHDAFWGSRRIHVEIIHGGNGFVFDRQTAEGDLEVINRVIVPVVDRWLEEFRYQLDGRSAELFTLTEGPVTVVGSTQGSCGYVYISATLDKSGDLIGLLAEEMARVTQSYTWAQQNAGRPEDERKYAEGRNAIDLLRHALQQRGVEGL